MGLNPATVLFRDEGIFTPNLDHTPGATFLKFIFQKFRFHRKYP